MIDQDKRVIKKAILSACGLLGAEPISFTFISMSVSSGVNVSIVIPLSNHDINIFQLYS